MWIQSILRLWSLRPARRRRPAPRPVSYTRVRLEWLEDRLAPAGNITTFTGAVSTDWNTAGNWTAGVPDGQDTAIIASQCIVNNNQDTHVTTLTINSGGALTVDTPLYVDATSFGSGTATVNNGGSMTIGGIGSNNPIFDAVNWNIGSGPGGSATATVGAATSANAAITGTTAVASGSSLTIGTAGDPGIAGSLNTANITSDASVTGGITISSAGSVQVSGTGALAGPVTDSGELEIVGSSNPGSASLTFGGMGNVTSGGILNIQPGAQATFAPSSSWVLGSGSNLHGTYFINGTLTVNGTIGTSDLAMTIADDGSTTFGGIIGAGAINNFKDIEWTGGTLALAGGVSDTSGSTFKTSSAYGKTLDCVLTLSNGADTLAGPGVITLTSAGKLVNIAGNTVGTLTLATSLAYSGSPSTPGSLVNNGTLALDPSAGPIIIGCQYISGSLGNVPSMLKIESGKATNPVTFTGGGTFSGTLVPNGGTIVLGRSGSSGNMLYTVAGNLDTAWSAGDLITIGQGATLSINSGASADFDHVSLVGTIAGAGQFSIDKDGKHNDDYLTWTMPSFGPPPSMSGTGTTLIGGTGGNGSTMTVGLSANLGGRTLRSRGVINVTSGGSMTMSGGSLYNNGTLTLAKGTSLSMTGGTLDNQAHGTFSLSGAATTSKTILHNEGSLTLAGSLTSSSGSRVNSGQWTIATGGGLVLTGGTLANQAKGTLTDNGAITLAGGTTLTNAGTVVLAGSMALGSGSTGMEAFTNTGTLTLDAGASLSLGKLTQTSVGTLVTHLVSSSPSGEGLLSLSGLASLAGALDVVLDNGYQPVSGTTFAILTFGSSTGKFTTTLLPSGMVVQYNTSNVTVNQT